MLAEDPEIETLEQVPLCAQPMSFINKLKSMVTKIIRCIRTKFSSPQQKVRFEVPIEQKEPIHQEEGEMVEVKF